MEFFCTENVFHKIFLKNYPTRLGRAYGPDPTRSGPAAWPGGAHPAGQRPRPASTPPPAVHARHDPSLLRPLKTPALHPTVSHKPQPGPSPTPRRTETSSSPPVLSSLPPPTICRFHRPSSRASTTMSSRLSRCISSAPHHLLLNAGAPPPLANRAGRHGWPSPAVWRPSTSKVSSPSCSPRSPPFFPQLAEPLVP
jgi:hypothetical protein